MTDSRPAPGVRSLAAPVLFAVLAGTIIYLCIRLGRLETELTARADATLETSKAVERTLQLLRVEAATNVKGPRAIVAQIEHWAPQLASSSTTHPVVQDIRERLGRTLDAAEALDPETFNIFERAFEASSDDEVRRWLLRAAVQVDRERGTTMCGAVVRGTQFHPSHLMRLRAADILTEVDRARAGAAIRDVLTLESSRGLVRELPTSRQKEYEEFVRSERFPQFYNFIERYVRTGHDDIEAVLQTLLNSSDHDRITYQECVKQLGKLGSKRSVARIKSLLERPPFGFADPLFSSNCLQAIADIEGENARGYFEEMLAQPGHPDIVQNKLQVLIKQVQGLNASTLPTDRK